MTKTGYPETVITVTSHLPIGMLPWSVMVTATAIGLRVEDLLLLGISRGNFDQLPLGDGSLLLLVDGLWLAVAPGHGHSLELLTSGPASSARVQRVVERRTEFV
jgi:hypothetical protein